MSRVLVGMSGGIDSALTAALLQREGETVIGAYCVMHDASPEERTDAQAVADALGIELITVDLRDRFESIVAENFRREYAAARTPNPCVLCNPTVKFAGLIETADSLGIDTVATGHYAAAERDPDTGRYFVRSVAHKDQSYMLCRLSQEQLARVRFPLGNRSKNENRALAKEWGIPVAEKPDSQEICFIRGESYTDYLERVCGQFPEGNFRLLEEDRIVGRHKGLIRYTVGQRKNLGIALGTPVYVRRLDPEKNEVILSREDAVDGSKITVTDPVFQALSPAETAFDAFGKIRFAARPASCRVKAENGILSAEFDTPQRAATPGQTAVFYDGDGRILCGGFIG